MIILIKCNFIVGQPMQDCNIELANQSRMHSNDVSIASIADSELKYIPY